VGAMFAGEDTATVGWGTIGVEVAGMGAEVAGIGAEGAGMGTEVAGIGVDVAGVGIESDVGAGSGGALVTWLLPSSSTTLRTFALFDFPWESFNCDQIFQHSSAI
jgi:hypothetical protein